MSKIYQKGLLLLSFFFIVVGSLIIESFSSNEVKVHQVEIKESAIEKYSSSALKVSDYKKKLNEKNECSDDMFFLDQNKKIESPYEIGEIEKAYGEMLDRKEKEKVINYHQIMPYSKNDPLAFVNYIKPALINFEDTHNIPWEIICSKNWTETQGGHTGAGKRGAGIGIKGKGIKGVDKKDNEKVEYQKYEFRWQMYSDFCKLLNGEKTMGGRQSKFYKVRFNQWMKYNPKLKDYEAWAYAMQVSPYKDKGKYAYAACGCKDGRNPECRKIRIKHAEANIRFIKKYCEK